ncbi:unnamed protein product [Blepharisma stoltei]|uniref:Uncharacterized protein n=1 Tax=Blepharisma stoltei TaxID=1481888 RepID=A0AAU9K8H9_9CILI|nr:unnamed protein product [Blepharisma stoltei]
MNPYANPSKITLHIPQQSEFAYEELERKLLIAKNKRHELYENSLREKLNYEREIRKLESQNYKLYRYNNVLEMKCQSVDPAAADKENPTGNSKKATSYNRNPLKEISGNISRSKSRDKSTTKCTKSTQFLSKENAVINRRIRSRALKSSEVPDLSPDVQYDESLFQIIDEIENMSIRKDSL